MELVKNVLRKAISAIQYISRYVRRLVTRDTDVIASLDAETDKANTRAEYLTKILVAKKKLLEARTRSRLLEQEISGLNNPLPSNTSEKPSD